MGACPNPPFSASKEPASSRQAACAHSGIAALPLRLRSAVCFRASRTDSAERSTSSRRPFQSSATRGISSSMPIRPPRPIRGMYVPAKKGRPCGVMMIVSGHPPRPVIIWAAVM